MTNRTWRTILPVNTTGRTKAEIVAEAEATWLLPSLFGERECGEGCRCMKCFHRKLDAAVKASEEALHESGIDIVGSPASDELQTHSFPDQARVP